MENLNFLNVDDLIHTPKEFEDVFDLLHDSLDLKISQIFMLGLTIGMKSGIKLPASDGNGRQFRQSYFKNKSDLGIQYALAIKEGILDGEEGKFADNKVQKQVKEMLSEYANQGFMILRDELFSNLIKQHKTKSIIEVIKLLSQYVIDLNEDIPF